MVKEKSILDQLNLSFLKPRLSSYLLENEKNRSANQQVKNISLGLKDNTNSFLNTANKKKKKLYYFGKLTQKIETNPLFKESQLDLVEKQTNQVLPRNVFPTEQLKNGTINGFQNFI